MLDASATKTERMTFICVCMLVLLLPPSLLCSGLLTMGTGVGVATGHDTNQSLLIGCLFAALVCIVASSLSALGDGYDSARQS